MPEWREVAATNNIKNYDFKIVELSDLEIAIFNIDNNFYAIEDNCPHQHLPIADGIVEDFTITCPYHGAQFDIRSGELKTPPACDNLRIFELKIVDKLIFIKL